MPDQPTNEAEAVSLQGLVWHLQNNFIPPQPLEVVDIALDAIDKVNSGDCESLITLPSGEVVTAQEVIVDLRLDFYITRE